ncbi:hypothetical protein R1flu_017818 [Riccia fluitans]|uniref:40S ribosomal protein S16 n=1 Tax=Riccia fluitans TaxID=41844 RepID=A0ABD1ZEC1_9MARC
MCSGTTFDSFLDRFRVFSVFRVSEVKVNLVVSTDTLFPPSSRLRDRIGEGCLEVEREIFSGAGKQQRIDSRKSGSGAAELREREKMAESVQCFGRKKTAVAVTYCKKGRGLIKINGCPIELVEPEILRFKAFEPILLLGRHRFANVDMRIRVRGGGFTSQIYAIRQSIAKALVAYYQKYVDEQSKKEIKDLLVRYDRTLLVADPRRCEPKKFGGRGARSRFQKSYR